MGSGMGTHTDTLSLSLFLLCTEGVVVVAWVLEYT